MMVDFATVQVHADTKEQLGALRRAGESYDSMLRRLMRIAGREEEDEFLRELNSLAADEKSFVPLE